MLKTTTSSHRGSDPDFRHRRWPCSRRPCEEWMTRRLSREEMVERNLEWTTRRLLKEIFFTMSMAGKAAGHDTHRPLRLPKSAATHQLLLLSS